MKIRKALIAGALATAVSVSGLHAPAMADEVPAASQTVAVQTAATGSSLLTPFDWVATKAFGEGYTMDSVTRQITAWVRLLTSIASVFTAIVSISTSVNRLSTTLANN